MFMVSLLAIALMGCPTESQTFDVDVRFSPGEASFLLDGTRLVFVSAEDTRCPVGQTCDMAGRAVVDLNFEIGDQIFPITLNDVEDTQVSVRNYDFEFLELTPLPGEDDSAPKVLRINAVRN